MAGGLRMGMADDAKPLTGRMMVVLGGLGRADLTAADALALRLRIGRAAAERLIWRAPVAISPPLLPAEARPLLRLLGDLGFDAHLAAEPPALSEQGFHVALCPLDPDPEGPSMAMLGRFLGRSPVRLAGRLGATRGWVLRRVGPAGVAALRRRFQGRAVAVRVSDPAVAAYDLVTQGMAPPAAHAVGLVGAAMGGGPFSSAEAGRLLRAFRRQGLRLVDRAFESHVVLLTALPANAAAAAALLALAPACLRRPLQVPMPLETGLDCHEAAEAVAAYRSAGLSAEACPCEEAARRLSRERPARIRSGRAGWSATG